MQSRMQKYFPRIEAAMPGGWILVENAGERKEMRSNVMEKRHSRTWLHFGWSLEEGRVFLHKEQLTFVANLRP